MFSDKDKKKKKKEKKEKKKDKKEKKSRKEPKTVPAQTDPDPGKSTAVAAKASVQPVEKEVESKEVSSEAAGSANEKVETKPATVATEPPKTHENPAAPDVKEVVPPKGDEKMDTADVPATVPQTLPAGIDSQETILPDAPEPPKKTWVDETEEKADETEKKADADAQKVVQQAAQALTRESTADFVSKPMSQGDPGDLSKALTDSTKLARRKHHMRFLRSLKSHGPIFFHIHAMHHIHVSQVPTHRRRSSRLLRLHGLAGALIVHTKMSS